MKYLKVTLIALGLMVLALPAGAAATSSQTNPVNAAKMCKQLRTQMGSDAFRAAYGTNKNKRNAFGKCVSQTKQAKAKLRAADAEVCAAERDADAAAFDEKYGQGAKNKHALASCIRAATKDDRTAIRSAQKSCVTERAADREAFAVKYGTNENHRNAFGKCVSKQAMETDQPETESPAGEAPTS